MVKVIDGKRIAEERIAEAARTGQDWLDLGDLGLKRLPERLTALTNLKRLNLGTYFILTPEGADGRRTRYEPNAFASIELLSALSNLRELFLDSSGCTNLDPISSLTQLEYLNLKDTRVWDLSPLTPLKQLRKLYCNDTQVRDLSPLTALEQLEHLDCAQTLTNDLSPLSTLRQLVELHCGGTLVSDLSPLGGLSLLRHLVISQTKVRHLKPLKGLFQLQDLVFSETEVDDLSPLATLSQLKSLYCNGTQVTDLTPISELQQLETLHIGGTPISDLMPLSGLKRLNHVEIVNTKVSDLRPLQELAELRQLNLGGTDVTDLAPISGLKGLQGISFGNTKVSDLAPIAGLDQLKFLYCANAAVTDLSHIANLRNLTHLFLGMTQVCDLSPLAGLQHLQHLDCTATKISTLSPLAGLWRLQTLSCIATAVNNLIPLARLTNLQHLDCSATQVRDLTPLIHLPNLKSLTFFNCRFESAPIEIWRKPSLNLLSLAFTDIPGIPDEILGIDCLERLRAHLTELEAGAEYISEAKVLILGNGRAGKTQIARRLAGQPFQPEWDSTHGIRITQVTISAQDSLPETHLKLWDFGGQEIYHGTHALFARTRAIFLLVWSQETELPAAEPDQHGMVFRNHPLRYWHAYAKDAGHKGSPQIIAQTRFDQDGLLSPPLDQDQVASSLCIQVSTADPPRIGTLRGALQDAVVTLQQSRGAVEIGKPRLILQRRIEALRQADGSLPEEWRLMEKSTFAAWYREAGGTASAEFALAYLNDNGTVFYRAGLFQDRIVLDQN
ncbi:MAG: hypothetical protein ING12_05900 [Roseomonas sp.]|nr:hypothetical protein [Roseomonas sp.]